MALVLRTLAALTLILVACNDETVAAQTLCGDGGQTCVDQDALGSCHLLAPGASAPHGLRVLAIVDPSVPTPAECSATAQPGPDIDAVGLYRTGADNTKRLIGVARPAAESVTFAAASSACPLNEHASPSAASGRLDGANNGGFFSLNGGTLELKFGACSPDQKDMLSCDGKGETLTLQSGDEIDVYEIDQWYADTGHMPQTCSCVAEYYELNLRGDFGGKDGQVCLGRYKGTTSHIRVP